MRFFHINIKRALLVLVYLCSAMAIFGQETPPANGCPPICGDYAKFDEIRTLSSTDLKVRLDNLVASLQRGSSDNVVYLIAYAGPVACVGEAQRLNLRAKKYLMRKQAFAAGQLFLTDGGYRQEAMLEIWVLPSRLPRPEPNATINRTQVLLRNCTKRSSLHRRRA
jgi:hypothetical protein